jgi:hypothetical protein
MDNAPLPAIRKGLWVSCEHATQGRAGRCVGSLQRHLLTIAEPTTRPPLGNRSDASLLLRPRRGAFAAPASSPVSCMPGNSFCPFPIGGAPSSQERIPEFRAGRLGQTPTASNSSFPPRDAHRPRALRAGPVLGRATIGRPLSQPFVLRMVENLRSARSSVLGDECSAAHPSTAQCAADSL